MAKYVLLALQWDQVLSKPTEPFRFVRYRKGDKLDLTGADERRLVRVGAVEPVKRSAPKAASSAKPEESKPELPADSDAEVDEGSDPESGEAESQVAGESVEKPAKTAPVAAWREYALTQGADADEVAETSRADLITLYG